MTIVIVIIMVIFVLSEHKCWYSLIFSLCWNVILFAKHTCELNGSLHTCLYLWWLFVCHLLFIIPGRCFPTFSGIIKWGWYAAALTTKPYGFRQIRKVCKHVYAPWISYKIELKAYSWLSLSIWQLANQYLNWHIYASIITKWIYNIFQESCPHSCFCYPWPFRLKGYYDYICLSTHCSVCLSVHLSALNLVCMITHHKLELDSLNLHQTHI